MKNSLITKIHDTKPSPDAMIDLVNIVTSARDTGKISVLDYGTLIEVIKSTIYKHIAEKISHLRSLSVTHPDMFITLIKLHQAYSDHNMLRIKDATCTRHEIQSMIIERNHRNIRFRV